jgi:hypothetical protein
VSASREQFMGVVRATMLKRGRGHPLEELEQACRSLDKELRGRPWAGVVRPLMIGQAPGPRTHPDLPLFPAPRASAGGRLREMTGLPAEDYLARFDRVNLLYEHLGKAPAGTEDRFPMRAGRAAALAMRPFLGGRQVLLVGRDVAVCFGHEFTPFLEWRQEPAWGYRYAVLPHPSGRNHWYNDAERRAAATAFLRAWVAGLAGAG